MTQYKTTLVPTNAVNLVTVINSNLITNFKLGVPAQVELKGLVDRAKIVHDESELMTVQEVVE